MSATHSKTFLVAGLGVLIVTSGLLLILEHNSNESISSSEHITTDSGLVKNTDDSSNDKISARKLDPEDLAESRLGLQGQADEDLQSESLSFSELMQRYTPSERELIIQFSDDHFGALEFSTSEQREWMRRHGYPGAEDVLAAEFLTLEELIEKAEAGDRVAMALVSERALDLMIKEGLKWRELGQDPLLADQVFFKYSLMAQQYAFKLQRAGSPFGAYLEARWAFESSLLSGSRPIDDVEVASTAATALSSLYVAEVMGDNRIDRFAQRFAYATGISAERLSATRLAFGAIRAAESGIGCETLFGNEPIP